MDPRHTDKLFIERRTGQTAGRTLLDLGATARRAPPPARGPGRGFALDTGGVTLTTAAADHSCDTYRPIQDVSHLLVLELHLVQDSPAHVHDASDLRGVPGL
jgi:hypothetical protein